MACEYPDADSPGKLWQNVLAGRRSFRRIPAERLRLEDYYSLDRHEPDTTYAADAALIDGYTFDRVRFRVSGDTFRATDLAHWLALDVAVRALDDAGFDGGAGLPRERTGVLVGNTLTGEFSRANSLRLRWPYVRRVVETACDEGAWSVDERRALLDRIERIYKAPFPTIGEETLAGGLSNTIAGRICNHFDLKGGGYTVDGACASSLLAVITSCSALLAGDLDVAVAGGVDLSLDPFEIVGFAKAGALAASEMRVFDTRSDGFCPGEGCGFIVLMREHDARAQGRRVYATVRGWGVSSDGSGGITRPELSGQLLALGRAYTRAGCGIDSVAYVEAHGTGTSVGDATELRALSTLRRAAGSQGTPAAIGSIKANVGHTKAAAGIAGLIKATMALQEQILPPTTGCADPHPELVGRCPVLRVLSEAEPWPSALAVRAGVSAMGFGGINAHLVVDGVGPRRAHRRVPAESSQQDAELFLFRGSHHDVAHLVGTLLTRASALSRGEVGDLAHRLEHDLREGEVRAAFVASTPIELESQLVVLRSRLDGPPTVRLDPDADVFVGFGAHRPRVAFLFPGQASPAHRTGGIWRRRFGLVRELYERSSLPDTGAEHDTRLAQPAIVTASLAGLGMLDRLGVEASVAVGHSLGEITALHWAGALDERGLLRVATTRGEAMAELTGPAGAMASIRLAGNHLASVLDGESEVVIAGLNAPNQTVVAGPTPAIARVVARAQASGIHATTLPVSHAFHSPFVAPAAPRLAAHLATEDLRPLQRSVISTITGRLLGGDDDVRALLTRQVTSPVRFAEAAASAARGMDLFLEVGPGHVLAGLVHELVDTPCVSLDAGGPSLRGLLRAAAAGFALGLPLRLDVLFEGRTVRPFEIDRQPRFFVSPCELAPVSRTGSVAAVRKDSPLPRTHAVPRSTRELAHGVAQEERQVIEAVSHTPASSLELVRRLVAARAELPLSAVSDGLRLLSDLHLNSIVVSEIVVDCARRRGLAPPMAPTDFANATVAEVAQALDELPASDGTSPEPRLPAGVDSWVRAFTVDLVERPVGSLRPVKGTGRWRVLGPEGHALVRPIEEALSHARSDGGVVVCLPPQPDERDLGWLLQSMGAALGPPTSAVFVLVQSGGTAASLARTFHLENPTIATCVVDVPSGHPDAVAWITTEIAAASGYREAHYDASGCRREPALRLLPQSDADGGVQLDSADVLLVTGGGKGIGAECALHLARQTGAQLALVGRSRPDEDPELAANLARLAAAGVRFEYLPADVTNAEAVKHVVTRAEQALGPVTGVLHAAGTNVPKSLSALDVSDFLDAIGPKLHGARNLAGAVNAERLKLFVTFGSIIARTGMRGEAHYAVANEWLAAFGERFQAAHPACRCLVAEWSVWAGAGMGERLGRIDALLREGITPIPLDDGVAMLARLIARRDCPVRVVVMGRSAEMPTLRLDRPELPLRRFLERPRVYYPGLELVADSDVSVDTDPYLDDHVFGKERLMPAVMGLEAMAQVAMALLPPARPPVFEHVRFERPIIVADRSVIGLRVAALAHSPDLVDVVIRSSTTAFQADHFRATCRFVRTTAAALDLETSAPASFDVEPLALDAKRELYGPLFFQRGRFERVRGYRRLGATECAAEIAPQPADSWFGPYLDGTLVLGDPGARDAVLHAIQPCIPHVALLPVAIDRLVPGTGTAGSRFVVARERAREGDTFVYDVECLTSDGTPCERWEGLRLRSAGPTGLTGAWVATLLGPYVERRVHELVPGVRVRVAVGRDDSLESRGRSDRAIRRALGRHVAVVRRPDGRPEAHEHSGVQLSVSHCGDLVVATAGTGPLGCDVEAVVARPEGMWQDLLGAERLALAALIQRDGHETLDAAATRVWTAGEALKKAGASVNARLALSDQTPDGWIVLRSGALVAATYLASLRDSESRMGLAVVARDTLAGL
jgi:enediyne polyketide synthase